jgi:hypothetical protein
VPDDVPFSGGGETMRVATRELAQRLSGTNEVLLLWHPESDRVDLSVRDLETGVGFEIAVAPANAIDAFYHPYAYAARINDSAARAASPNVR